MQSKLIELAIFWLPIVGGVLFGSIAVGAWFADKKILAIWIGFAGVVCFLLLATIQAHEHYSKVIETPVNPAVVSTIDKPTLLPVDVGMIRISLPNGVRAAPYVQFQVKNFGNANGMLLRLWGKFVMIEPPLTKERLNAYRVEPGQIAMSGLFNNTILAPGDSLDTGPINVPPHIKIENYQSRFGRPDMTSKADLFFFVAIEYEDLSGKGWVSHSCWTYDRYYSSGSLLRHGGKEWNYEEAK